MSRIEEMRARDRLRKQKEIEDFINDVNVIHNNVDGLKPSIETKKEYENNYTNYFIAKHPNCLKYHISMYKKEYPFKLYYTKDFYKNDIPEKHKAEFEKLEKYFK